MSQLRENDRDTEEEKSDWDLEVKQVAVSLRNAGIAF